MMEMDLRKEIEQILNEEIVISLATSSDDGAWASDLLFVHDNDLAIYWKSSTETRHSRNISKNPQAAATVTSTKENGSGLQLTGTVEVVNSDLVEELNDKLRAKRQALYGQHIAERETARENDRQWYRLTPSVYYFMNEGKIGYSRLEFKP